MRIVYFILTSGLYTLRGGVTNDFDKMLHNAPLSSIQIDKYEKFQFKRPFITNSNAHRANSEYGTRLICMNNGSNIKILYLARLEKHNLCHVVGREQTLPF